MKIPLALFVYNRLDHTKQTINHLLKNDLNDIVLYIFSDGPLQHDINSVNEVRQYIRSITDFEEIHIIESSENIGLACSIINGVSKILDEFDSIIVLEDDLIVSKYFIDFMKTSLDLYADNPRVMSISGYSLPLFSDDDKISDTYFLDITTSWGWATWKKSWALFEKNPDKLINTFTKQDIFNFNINNSENFWRQVLFNKKGILNTWAIFWYASIFINRGLTLFPKISMVKNIGHDGTGTNCIKSDRFNTLLDQNKITYFEKKIEVNNFAKNKLEKFYRSTNVNLFRKLLNYLKLRFKSKFFI